MLTAAAGVCDRRQQVQNLFVTSRAGKFFGYVFHVLGDRVLVRSSQDVSTIVAWYAWLNAGIYAMVTMWYVFHGQILFFSNDPLFPKDCTK